MGLPLLASELPKPAVEDESDNTDPSSPPITVSGADFLGGEKGPPKSDSAVELDVWVCNVPAIEAFQFCVLAGIGTMSRIYWLGFTAQEVTAGLELADIPVYQRSSVGADVSYMGRMVAKALNK